MKRIALLLAAGLLVMWQSSVCAQQARAAEFTVGAIVNAQGAVTKTEAEPSVAPGIAGVLDQAIRYWRFAPVQRNGKGVPVHTFITARLDVLPAAGGKLDLKVSYLRQGPKTSLFKARPSYPPEAMRTRLQGLVLLLGTLPAHGNAVVSLAKCAERDCNLLRHSVVDWFQHGTWTPETIDGQPVSAQARAFVTFRLIPVTTVTHKPLAQEAGITHEERALLHQYGFTDNDVRAGVNQLVLSSVLKPLMVRPVVMHLGPDDHS